MTDFIKKAKAVMIGHAVGDALGVPVEFRTREYLDENPITDMIGYGTYPVPKGAWSDDTSMSLCALASFSDGKDNFYKTAQNFVKWLYRGDFTPTGKPFDAGRTCREAINNFIESGDCYNCGLSDEYSNGNGSLMRIHAFALKQFFTIVSRHTPFEISLNLYRYSLFDMDIIRSASSLTHAHPRARVACILYTLVLWEILRKPCKESIQNTLSELSDVSRMYEFFLTNYDYKRRINIEKYMAEKNELKNFKRLFNSIEKLDKNELKSDGYVVHTLESAIWCLLTTDSYKDCVLKAVNLGRDTDTTAAVAGGLAGALYGYDAIPEDWRNTLLEREYIEELCEKAFSNIIQ